MKTKIFFAVLVLFFSVVLLLFLRGEEDGWICVKGKWQSHGRPSLPQPTKSCAEGDAEEKSTTTVKIYFSNTSTNLAFLDCSEVSPVERVITSTPRIGQAALEELLKGPFPFESRVGYFTSINPGVEILSLKVVEGVAEVDFSKKLEEAVGGSCRITNIRSQIENTLKQFPAVKNVIIKIEGNSEAILQP